MTITIDYVGHSGAKNKTEQKANGYAKGMVFQNRMKAAFTPLVTCTSQKGAAAAITHADSGGLIAIILALGEDENLTITIREKGPAVVLATTPRTLKVYADPSNYHACTIRNVALAIKAGVLHEMARGTRIFIMPEDFCESLSASSKLFTEEEIRYFEHQMADLCRYCRDMVVVTGTLMWKNATHFRKRAYVLFGGAVHAYDKVNYVSGDDSGLSFAEKSLAEMRGSTSGFQFDFDGMKYVVHICADAGVVKSDADLQIVVANGFGALPSNGVHERGTSIIVDVDQNSVVVASQATASRSVLKGEQRLDVLVEVKNRA